MGEKNLINKCVKKISKSVILQALIINLIFFVLAILFCEQKYEVSDDFVMETLLSGAYGTNINPHMMFINTIYGYLLWPLYYLFPTISWYLISFLALGFFSFVAISYLVLSMKDKTTGMLLSVLFLCSFSNDIYILVQFTKIAALCIISGAFLVLFSVFQSHRKVELLTGALLCFMGCLIRFEAIAIVGIFVLIVIIGECICFFRKQKIEYNRYRVLDIRFIKIVCTGAGIMIFIILCEIFNWYTYHNDEEYQYYYQYTQARAAIVDSVDYGYGEYESDLQKIGISENDYLMLRTWNFSDSEYFPVEKLHQIADIIEEHNQNRWDGWQIIFENMQMRGYGTYKICIACLILLIFGVIWNTKYWWGYVGSALGGFVLLLYFYVRGRVLYRIEYGIFLGVYLAMLYFCMKGFHRISEDKKSKKAAVIIMMLCCSCQIPVYIPDSAYKLVSIDDRKGYLDDVFNASWNYDPRKYRKVVKGNELEYGLVAEMKSHPENFYLLDFNTTIQSLYYDWDAFESLGENYYKNFCYMSGVTMNFPDVNHVLQNNGIDNPLTNLVKEDVYLVDNINSERILIYLQEHYYPDASIEWVKNVEGYNIWKISSE